MKNKAKEIVIKRNEYGFPKAEVKPVKEKIHEMRPQEWESSYGGGESAYDQEVRKYWDSMTGNY